MEAAFHVKGIRTAWSGGLQSPFSGKAPPSSTPCGPASTPTRQNRPRPRLFPLFRPNGATAPFPAEVNQFLHELRVRPVHAWKWGEYRPGGERAQFLPWPEGTEFSQPPQHLLRAVHLADLGPDALVL